MTARKAELLIGGQLCLQIGRHPVGDTAEISLGSGVHLTPTVGGDDDDIGLVARPLRDQDLLVGQSLDLLVQIGQGDPRLQADLLGRQGVVIAGAYDVLADLALHEVPKIIGAVPAIQGNEGLGIVAKGSESAFHIHTFFQQFSGFEQEILDHALADRQLLRDLGAGLAMDVVEDGGTAVPLREKGQLTAQTVDILVFFAVKGRLLLLGGYILSQLKVLPTASLTAPLLVDVVRHAPHEGVKGVVITDISRGSNDLIENILGQVLRLLAGRGTGNAIVEYGLGDLGDPSVQLFGGHGVPPACFLDASAHIVNEFGNG